MEFIKTFLSEYGMEIIGAVVAAVAGYLGLKFKGLYTKHIDTETKQAVAKTCVSAVEQLYRDSDGDKKFTAAAEYVSSMLSERGIKITEEEIELLIESAVGEFNRARATVWPGDFLAGVETIEAADMENAE